MGFGSTESSSSSSAMLDFLQKSKRGYAVLDGGLATELERHGADLNDPLWSATCLIHSPQLIRREFSSAWKRPLHKRETYQSGLSAVMAHDARVRSTFKEFSRHLKALSAF